jgi:hypothetical protein
MLQHPFLVKGINKQSSHDGLNSIEYTVEINIPIWIYLALGAAAFGILYAIVEWSWKFLIS